MAKLQFKTLREEVLNVIRMRILTGDLSPGARIVEQDIAEDLGVSRAPVREALRQIEQEGLVEYVRNVGCSVKQITYDDIYEIYLMRATYEIMCVKLCHGKFDIAIKTMEKALTMMESISEKNFEQAIIYDNDFHGGIIQQVGLPRLKNAWKALNGGNVITYYAGSPDQAKTVGRQYAIHRELYESYLTEDSDTVCGAIMDHYMLTIHRLLRERGVSHSDFNYDLDIRF